MRGTYSSNDSAWNIKVEPISFLGASGLAMDSGVNRPPPRPVPQVAPMMGVEWLELHARNNNGIQHTDEALASTLVGRFEVLWPDGHAAFKCAFFCLVRSVDEEVLGSWLSLRRHSCDSDLERAR